MEAGGGSSASFEVRWAEGALPRSGALLLCLALLCALAVPASAALPDGRGWELVSPVEKNGGQVATPAEAGPGSSRAAAGGGAVAYASRASFAGGAGAAPFSNYIARRTSSGWVTENITPAHLTGAYEGSPYRAFSSDLSLALLLNPARCPAGDPCPSGYRVRDNNTGEIVAELDDPGEFEPAEDAVTFFVEAGHLYRQAGSTTTDLTPSGGAETFLAADAAGSTAYYRSGGGIWRWRQGVGATQILTAFPASTLADVSALTAGATADGNRLYFTTAARFPLADVNLAPDVYQWQVQGSGSCAKAAGCVDLISSGLTGTSIFFGTSADGSDVFFVTDRSLVGGDPDSVDLYDARVGGGFPEPVPPPLCVGDACQVVPPRVEDPVLTTVTGGVGNPAERYRAYGAKARCSKGKRLKTVKRKGRWVQKCVGADKGKAKRGGRR